MAYLCPVCAYPDLPTPPENFSICPSCGTEFGFDDAGMSYRDLRNAWIKESAPWFNDRVSPPEGWNPWLQLIKGGYGSVVPYFSLEIRAEQPKGVKRAIVEPNRPVVMLA